MPKCLEDEKFPCRKCKTCEERVKLRPLLDWTGMSVFHKDKADLGNFVPA